MSEEKITAEMKFQSRRVYSAKRYIRLKKISKAEEKKRKTPFCLCGCGVRVSLNPPNLKPRKFIIGHHLRKKLTKKVGVAEK